MAGYLIMVTGALFVDGAQTVIQNEQNKQKIAVAGVCFWIGAAFQFETFALPDLGPVWGALLDSGITTGGLAAVVMILYLEFTNPRRMRFQSPLHVDALPALNVFIDRFADRRGWDVAHEGTAARGRGGDAPHAGPAGPRSAHRRGRRRPPIPTTDGS